MDNKLLKIHQYFEIIQQKNLNKQKQKHKRKPKSNNNGKQKCYKIKHKI